MYNRQSLKSGIRLAQLSIQSPWAKKKVMMAKRIFSVGDVNWLFTVSYTHLDVYKRHDLSVSEVAFAVGFKDSGYYSKCFRKKYNQTPREYMNEWRKG